MYSREKYDGEVYQMTFNCTSNPYCLVFKLNGTTDLKGIHIVNVVMVSLTTSRQSPSDIK